MAVIQFPAKPGVEITAGAVLSSTVIDASGAHSVPEDLGRFLFFVDVVEADGGRIGMWSGEDHLQAVQEAEALAQDFGGSVRDKSGRAA